MREQPRFVDLVKSVHDSLVAGHVGHGFGGAIALAYYVGEPRATRDLNINISVPAGDAATVLVLLPAIVSWSDKDVIECAARGQVRLWVGRPREGIPVDLFFPQHRFHEAVARATTQRPFLTTDYSLPVISASHLVVFKALFNRPKDWVDIEAMLRAGTVDLGDALHWVQELLGENHPSLGRLVALIADHAADAGMEPGGAEDLPQIDWSSLGGS